MKKVEEDHIKKVGEKVFARALSLATIEVCGDRHLVGLDKLREPLAFQAALKATGFHITHWSLGKKDIPADIMPILDGVFKRATIAATALVAA